MTFFPVLTFFPKNFLYRGVLSTSSHVVLYVGEAIYCTSFNDFLHICYEIGSISFSVPFAILVYRIYCMLMIRTTQVFFCMLVLMMNSKRFDAGCVAMMTTVQLLLLKYSYFGLLCSSGQSLSKADSVAKNLGVIAIVCPMPSSNGVHDSSMIYYLLVMPNTCTF